MRRFHLLAGLFLLLALMAGTPCSAQSSSLPQEILTAKAALTKDQKEKLQVYVTRIGNVWATGNPGEVVSTRNELIELCKSVNMSEVCRRELAQQLVKAFQPLTKSPETFRATNAFLTAQFLKSPDAMDFLVDNLSPTTQSDSGLRAAAAAQLPKTFPSAGLSPPQMDAYAKRLVAAAKEETNWRAIAAEIECIGEMLATKLPSAQAVSVADSQAAIINSVTERALKGGEKEQDLVSAVQRGLLVVRNQLTNVNEPGRGKLLQGISPSLDQIKQANTQRSGTFGANPQQEAAFKNAVITAELLQNVPRLDKT